MTQPPVAAPTYADARSGTRHVFVSQLEVLTTIGVHDAEKRAPQRVIVSVDLAVRETGPAGSDRLVDVLDYAGVVRLVERLTREFPQIRQEAVQSQHDIPRIAPDALVAHVRNFIGTA